MKAEPQVAENSKRSIASCSSAWVAALENQWRERARSMCEQANGFERNEMYEHATGFRNRASVYFECAEELSKASAVNEKGQ